MSAKTSGAHPLHGVCAGVDYRAIGRRNLECGVIIHLSRHDFVASGSGHPPKELAVSVEDEEVVDSRHDQLRASVAMRSVRLRPSAPLAPMLKDPVCDFVTAS